MINAIVARKLTTESVSARDAARAKALSIVRDNYEKKWIEEVKLSAKLCNSEAVIEIDPIYDMMWKNLPIEYSMSIKETSQYVADYMEIFGYKTRIRGDNAVVIEW